MLKNICSRHHGVPPPPNTTLQLHTNTTVHDCYVLKAQLFNKQKEETIDSNTLSYNKIYTQIMSDVFFFSTDKRMRRDTEDQPKDFPILQIH